jgi:hypothetical protein
VTPAASTDAVDAWKNPNEDERGVDVGQIRELLRMSVAQRAHEMVRVANLMAKAVRLHFRPVKVSDDRFQSI